MFSTTGHSCCPANLVWTKSCQAERQQESYYYNLRTTCPSVWSRPFSLNTVIISPQEVVGTNNPHCALCPAPWQKLDPVLSQSFLFTVVPPFLPSISSPCKPPFHSTEPYQLSTLQLAFPWSSFIFMGLKTPLSRLHPWQCEQKLMQSLLSFTIIAWLQKESE